MSLTLEQKQSIVAEVNGVPVMECSYGTSNKHYALRVQKMINHHDRDSGKERDHD